ncbi:MAG TPA: MFS transporter [Tepidisphaeraceae bacterium]|nr:MFS transporter [Tepidisphaeraceae bacterium]
MPSFFESFPLRVLRVYAAHFLASIGSNLFLPAFFFYAHDIFGWGARRNLMLAAAEGIVYMIGALSAQKLARVAGRRRGSMIVQFTAGCIAVVAGLHPSPLIVTPAVLAYTMVSAAGWPIFESLISGGAGPDLMSRRVGAYNLVWSFVGAATLAVSGTIIHDFPWGMFLLPAAAHGVAILLLFFGNIEPPATPAAADALPAHPQAEPALLRERKLALQLSRIGLPATYVVVYSLVAIMPSLPVIRMLGTSSQTVIASVWMASRFAAFVVLGGTVWWHTRPRVLLIAAVVMLVAFLGVTLRPADILGNPAAPANGLDEGLMVLAQVFLGLSMGMIYAGSLYFGMVLSEGSTEHGGYHEALIGLGQMVGTAAAAAAQTAWPGTDRAAVGAVALIVGISVIAAALLVAKNARKKPAPNEAH